MAEQEVVVVGAGMSGLCAAVAAAEAGAVVTVLEKSHAPGGSLQLSGGLLWTFPDEKTIDRLIPNGDPVLQSKVSSQLVDATAWLEKQGVHIGRDVAMPHGGAGREIAPPQVIQAMHDRLLALGGSIQTDAALESLMVDAEGAVVGVRALIGTPARLRQVAARAVVLATGGFQGNAELVRRLLDLRPEDVKLRSNRWSTGDGLLAAMAAGASSTPGLTHFYGHALTAPPATYSPEKLREASQYYGAEAVAINMSGLRFVDEAAGTGEEHVNGALARQRDGRGFYILDERIAAGTTLLDLHVQTIIERAISFGAPYAKADTFEDLCEQLGDLGVARAALLGTLTSFNEAMSSGNSVDLDPPRSGETFTLSAPPFQAVGVQAALTFTMGGIAVDSDMRVLARTRSTSLLDGPANGVSDDAAIPIPGLLAAGCDIGGVHYGGYMGGLATALVTGRAAGSTAAA